MPTVSYRNYSGTAAENYQRYFVPAIAEPVAAVLLHTAALRPGERMLDVACGTGVIARHVGDATTLPFPDNAYDIVLCQMGLMFIEDRAAAVAEMYRVLAAGGRLVVVTPGEIQPLFIVLERALVEHINADLGRFVRAVFSMHDPDAVAALLHDARLQHVTSTTSSARLRLPAPAEFLWQYIGVTPIAPLVAQASEAVQ